MKLGIVMIGAALLATGCGSADETGGGTSPAGGGSPVGKTYVSTAVTEDGKDKPLASKIRLGFEDTGTLSARAGCNHLGGMVAIEGGTLVIDAIGGTEIGCQPAVQAQEEWLKQLLLDRPAWKLDGDVLTITRASTTLVLQDRELVEPDLPLEGTKWSVDSVVSGEAFEHFPHAGTAYLTITGNQATGSTGCNEFTGPVTHTGNTLTFGLFTITAVGCSGEPARLERAVLANLHGKLTYTIDSNCLQLRGPNNNSGLNLTSPTEPTRACVR